MDFDQDDDSGTFTLRIKSRSDEHEGTQKKTFTKWINSQLAKSGTGQQVKDLFEDLKDGTKLLLLLEILCGKRIRSERGRTRVHFMTNVDNALRILEQNNVRPVNISNDDIVDGNPKLTLGLMWYIISHFQVYLGVRKWKVERIKEVRGLIRAKLAMKCAKTTAMLTAALLISFFPSLAFLLFGEIFAALRRSSYFRWSMMLAQLYSLFNPAFYCYRDRRFRNAFLEMVKMRRPASSVQRNNRPIGPAQSLGNL